MVLCEGFSEQADAGSPVVLGRSLGVDDDVIWEGVGVGGRNGRDVILVAVYDGDDLVCRLLERLSHGTADFDDI